MKQIKNTTDAHDFDIEGTKMFRENRMDNLKDNILYLKQTKMPINPNDIEGSDENKKHSENPYDPDVRAIDNLHQLKVDEHWEKINKAKGIRDETLDNILSTKDLKHVLTQKCFSILGFESFNSKKRIPKAEMALNLKKLKLSSIRRKLKLPRPAHKSVAKDESKQIATEFNQILSEIYLCKLKLERMNKKAGNFYILEQLVDIKTNAIVNKTA